MIGEALVVLLDRGELRHGPEKDEHQQEEPACRQAEAPGRHIGCDAHDGHRPDVEPELDRCLACDDAQEEVLDPPVQEGEDDQAALLGAIAARGFHPGQMLEDGPVELAARS